MTDQMSIRIADTAVELIRGDITMQPDVDAIVNAANRMLGTGGGVAGAIHGAAGPELAVEAQRFAPISPGDAVVTRAYNLPNSYVVHCLGPVYGTDRPEDELLASCYSNALARAEEVGIGSVAFPAISTGIFGYPVGEASRVALQTVLGEIPHLRSVKLIRFVFFDDETLAVNTRTLASLLGYHEGRAHTFGEKRQDSGL